MLFEILISYYFESEYNILNIKGDYTTRIVIEVSTLYNVHLKPWDLTDGWL